jgi:hypothetical protein
MLKTLEIIKEQIKVLKNEQKGSQSAEIAELKELIEFIECDSQILEFENQKLRNEIQQNVLNKRLNALTEALTKEKMKGMLLAEKLEELEKSRNQKTSKFANTGNFTERHERSLNSSISVTKSPLKSSKTMNSKSPIKPPRHEDRKIKSFKETKNVSVVKNKLDNAIDQAYKSLSFNSSANRSVSPCFSTSSSRYSTPGKKGVFNTSLSSN